MLKDDTHLELLKVLPELAGSVRHNSNVTYTIIRSWGGFLTYFNVEDMQATLW